MSGVAAWLTGIARAGHEFRPAEWCTGRPTGGRGVGLVLPGPPMRWIRPVGDGSILEPTAVQRRADIVCDLVKERLHEAPTGDAGLPSQRGPRPSPRDWALSTRLLVGIQW